MANFIENQTFERAEVLAKGEYEQCTFLHCDFSNADLGDIKFNECEFKYCNLSNANLSRAAFRDARFADCKMLGLRFETCNDFGFSIHVDHCQLNYASFYQRKLKQSTFKRSQMLEVDFTECELGGVVFAYCELSGATFERSNLERADFRTASGYALDPEKNNVKKARFSLDGVVGLLGKYDIEVD